MDKCLQVIQDDTGVHIKVNADAPTAVAMLTLLVMHVSKQLKVTPRQLSNTIVEAAEKTIRR